jgi:hypothetical protein
MASSGLRNTSEEHLSVCLSLPLSLYLHIYVCVTCACTHVCSSYNFKSSAGTSIFQQHVDLINEPLLDWLASLASLITSILHCWHVRT